MDELSVCCCTDFYQIVAFILWSLDNCVGFVLFIVDR